jgi:hypothetical protein
LQDRPHGHRGAPAAAADIPTDCDIDLALPLNGTLEDAASEVGIRWTISRIEPPEKCGIRRGKGQARLRTWPLLPSARV